jgi:hypothetical protein
MRRIAGFMSALSPISFASGKSEIFFAPKRAKSSLLVSYEGLQKGLNASGELTTVLMQGFLF